MNRIAYATGQKNYEDYTKRMLEIETQFYDKQLAHTDLTANERLSIQAQYYEAVRKETERANKQSIEDEIRFIGSYPYGLEAGGDYILYSPDTPVEGLNEELISWWPGRFSLDGAPETLESWCIYSLEGGYGFFGYDA